MNKRREIFDGQIKRERLKDDTIERKCEKKVETMHNKNDWRMGRVEIELSSAKLGNVGQPNFTPAQKAAAIWRRLAHFIFSVQKFQHRARSTLAVNKVRFFLHL